MAPTLVLLHGFTHTGASWNGVRAALGERYRALAPDIRGHGSAGDAEPVSLEAVIHDVAAAARERFVLAGYSMGGRIALHVALALPERVERLILISMTPGISDPAEREARRRADERLAVEVERLGLEEFARRWQATGVLAGQPATVAAAAHADRLRNTPAGIARVLRGLGPGTMPSAWHMLGELRMPVVIVAGERDEKYVGIAEKMERGIVGADLVIVPAVGHAVHLEAPDHVAAIIPGRTR